MRPGKCVGCGELLTSQEAHYYDARCEKCERLVDYDGGPENTPTAALKNIIAAWDSLRTGDYSRDIIETWLADKMKPAIDQARHALDDKRS